VSSIATSCIVFACVFGGALLGMLLRNFLPEHHLDPDSRNVVNLGMALIGTMTALVLGLLIASAKSSYDTQELTPRNDFEHSLQSQALLTAFEIGQTRSLLVEQAGSSIPMPFLVVMVFWLAVIFASFGLFAPRNATVIATLFVCAMSVSGAIFLILELDSPFSCLLQISDAPLRNAITHIGM
jgi:hypothetical protein